MTENTLFAIGDYVAGGLVGAATAAAVRTILSPETDMAIAMLFGMAIGMAVHLILSLLLSPVLGTFHIMVPGSLIGMYGGMLFAMRDTMQAHVGSARAAIEVGVVFGVIVTAGVRLYDRALRSTASSDTTN